MSSAEESETHLSLLLQNPATTSDNVLQTPTGGIDGSTTTTSIKNTPLKIVPCHHRDRKGRAFDRIAKIWILTQLGLPLVLAIVVMGIHLAFFKLLNDVLVDEAAVSQAVQIALANILSLIVEICLLAGISVAYDQVLWREFRRQPLRAVVIDKLLTLATSPWNLLRFDLFRHAPLEWLLAFCCLLIPIALVFPPGTMNVEFKERVSRTKAQMPTLNISDFGDHSGAQYYSRTLYTVIDGNATKPLLSSLAASVLATNDPPRLPDSCRGSCAYTLDIRAPAFKCDKPALVPMYTLPDITFYRAYLNYDDWNSNSSSKPPLFTVSWKKWNAANSTSDGNHTVVVSVTPDQMNCSFVMADYKMDIAYTGGNRTIQTTIDPTETQLEWRPDVKVNGVKNDLGSNADTPEFAYNFTMAQAFSLMQAATMQVSGSYIWGPQTGIEAGISGGGGYNKSEAATSFVASSFVDTSTSGELTVNVSAEKLQNYLTNVIISAIALNSDAAPLWQTDPTLVLNGANVYAFNQQEQFYIPYGASLITTLLIYALGLYSLHQNGVSAGNSFLQYVTATRISERLDKAAMDSCRGGHENFTNDLKKLELRYGVCRTTTHRNRGDGELVTGFGTVDEFADLRKD